MKVLSALRVLILEDSWQDAELMVDALARAGLKFEWERVETEDEFRRRLAARPDLILSDYQMPRFNGLDALEVVRVAAPDTPFILVSGWMGEDLAVAAMKAGADDYILKDRMGRLGEAARQALERRRLRREKAAMEEALEASRARNRAIVANALDAIITMDADGRVLDLNPAAEATFGYTRALAAGRELAELIIPPEVRDAHRRGLEVYKRTGKGAILNRRVEVTAMHRDGSRLPVELTVVPIHTRRGTIFGSHLRDISERKRVEAEIRESEARFRQLAESIREVFWLTDPAKQKILYVSPAYDEIWGRSRARLYEHPEDWIEAIHPGDREQVAAAARTLQVTGDYAEEYRVQRPDGSVRWIRDQAYPVTDEDGNVHRIAGVAEDITDRKAALDALRESERRFGDMLRNVELISLMLDREARITYCNDHLLGLTGWRREEVLGRDWFERFIPKDNTGLKGVFATLLEDQPETWHHENEILTQSGSRRLVRWNNSVLRSITGEVIGTASIGEDITERAEAEKKVRRLNRVYAVLSGISALIVRARSRAELFQGACRIAVEQGELKAAWISVLDAASSEVTLAAHWGAEVGPVSMMPRSIREDGRGGRGLVARALRERKAQVVNDVAASEIMVYRDEVLAGGFRSVVVLPLIAGDQPVAVMSLMSEERGVFDEEEVKLLRGLAGDLGFALDHLEKAARLDYLAFYDALTGLPNRTLMRERLTQYVGAAEREGRRFALLLFNIERFHLVNNTYGRDQGDELLRQVAQRIAHVAPDRNAIARVGPDVFAMLVPAFRSEDDLGRILEIGERKCFGQPFRLGDAEVTVSSKAGVVLYPEDGRDAETLLRHADVAVQRARKSDRQYLFYTREMTQRVAESLGLELKLRKALAEEQFVLHYQPKVNLATGTIAGVEALIRWHSPELGLVPPVKFIPLLEETGLILQVGAWALRQAALDYRQLAARGLRAPRIAVNVSAIQLRERSFVDTLSAAIEHELEPVGIDLEITESLIMENVEGTVEKLKALRALGINVAIDDFGTGYSSLAYLARLPVQALKIDRAFIKPVCDNPDATTLVSTMISLAHSLRLKVVAEGVETQEQADLLRLVKCDEMQGYLVAKPMPLEALQEFLQAGPPA